MFSEFRNEALTDFSLEPNRRAFAAALERVRARLPIEGKLLIDGEWLKASSTFESRNPSARDEVIGRFAKGTRADALKAVDAAAEAFRTWKQTPPDDRAKIVMRIASIIRDRKH